MRAIDSDHVIARLDEIQPFAGNKAANAAINLAKDVVRNAPTVSPDDLRPVGKWIPLEPEIGLYGCSRCEHMILRAECNYCPNCGAAMLKGE